MSRLKVDDLLIEPVKKLPAVLMKKIPAIANTAPTLAMFIVEVNRDIKRLNALIDSYNKTDEKPGQIDTLQKISLLKQQIDNKYSDKQINACPEYRREIHRNLFQELQTQFVSLGIPSLLNITKRDLEDDAPVVRVDDSLPEILANMAPEKASMMLAILSEGAHFNKVALSNLYAPAEPGYAEFTSFLGKNTVTFLGGGNSKNFKITPNDASPPFVLKVDNRMGMPKSAEAHLRDHSLQDIFTPTSAERQVTGTQLSTGNEITRTLLVTEFCSGGDLESHNKTHGADTNARLASAISIYSQMGMILSGISRDGCAFPDMKNSNWLIDEHGKVRLADTKSFVFVEDNNVFDKTKNVERWFNFISTKFMNPPEFACKTFSADKMHSSMLGKDLYQYLSGCSYKDLHCKYAVDFPFTAPVFQTAEGKELKSLIMNMVIPNPDDRLSLTEAMVQINKFQLPPEKKACQDILIEIMKNSFGANDKAKMDVFLQKMDQRIREAAGPDSISVIQKELEAINHGIKAVSAAIKSLRDASGLLSVGTKAKAERISVAMMDVPIEERGNLLTGQSPEIIQVKVALASHRHWGKGGTTYLDNKGQIDETKAASTFQDFKKRVGALKPEKPDAVERDNPEPRQLHH